MKGINIRTLYAEEIEIRVQSVTDKGVSLLLYKDARVDMTILDEVFGLSGWQRIHEYMNGSCFCRVSVKDPDTGEWITKQDVGTESFSDPVKGAASDSFKRACTNIGIGRELYSAPFIWIPTDKVNIVSVNGKNTCKDKFHVKSISYDDKRTITSLVICNQRKETVYTFGKSEVRTAGKIEKGGTNKISEKQAQQLEHRLKLRGLSVQSVLNKHGLEKLADMDIELYNKAMESLAKPVKISA